MRYLKVKENKLNEFSNFVLNDENVGIEKVEKPRLVFFDYGGANVAKELHVGHLRSPIVGESLKRVHIALGDKTLSDVHLGDYGLQMGLTILHSGSGISIRLISMVSISQTILLYRL